MNDAARHRENMQRLQVGLTGLLGIMLLIGLANLVVERIRSDDAAIVAASNVSAVANAANAVAPPTEPLAELGVTPTADTATSVVPDLQPDPRLAQPMDRSAPPARPR